MKKIFFWCFPAIILLSCNENDKTAEQATDGSTPPQGEISSTQGGFNTQAHTDSIMKNPVVSTSFNTESAFKLASTMPDHSRFGVLLGYSSYAKQIHHEPWTVLAPTNAAMEKFPVEVAGIMRDPANLDLLDKFIANHIIEHPFSITKIQNVTEVKTITGKKVPVSAENQTINGAEFIGTEYFAKIGSVVPLSEVIDFPAEELQKRLKKISPEKEAQK